VLTLSHTHIFDLLLTLATNAENDPLFTTWNTLILETFYLLFRGVPPSSLVQDQAQVRGILGSATMWLKAANVKAPKHDLIMLLAMEEKRKRNIQRNAASRHSRFGTTISVKSNEESMVLHTQEAITHEACIIVDGTKKKRHQKAKKLVRDTPFLSVGVCSFIYWIGRFGHTRQSRSRGTDCATRSCA